MSQSGGRVGSSNQCEGSIMLRIFEHSDSVFEWIMSIGHSVVNVAVDVRVPDKSVDDLCATHQIIISKHQVTSSFNISQHINQLIPSCCL